MFSDIQIIFACPANLEGCQLIYLLGISRKIPKEVYKESLSWHDQQQEDFACEQ